jgi:putative transposase
VEYLAIRYTERLADAGAVRSAGSRGDSYDNALAESVVGLFKTELVRKKKPWRTLEQVELATAQWVDWYNNRRLHSSIGNLPPAQYEAAYGCQLRGICCRVKTKRQSLHQTQAIQGLDLI